jgi:ABC-2 type transport system permease protein
MIAKIYILWLRQIRRYVRSRARMIGSLGQPLLYLLVFGFGFGSTFQKANGGNYIQFLVPGVIAQSVLFLSIFSGIEVIFDRQFGFLREMLVAPVSRLEIMLGRTIGGATVAVLQGLIVMVIALLVGFRFNPWNLPLALIFIAMIALLFTALGVAIASVLEDLNGFQLIINFLILPTFFLSGALFPLDNIPFVLKILTSLDPLTYGVDGLRGAFTGISHFGIGFDFTILSVLTIIILVIGAYLFSKIEV